MIFSPLLFSLFAKIQPFSAIPKEFSFPLYIFSPKILHFHIVSNMENRIVENQNLKFQRFSYFFQFQRFIRQKETAAGELLE